MPAAGATNVLTGSDVKTFFNEPMAPATINDTTFELRRPGSTSTLVGATGTYSDNSTQDLTAQVSWASATPAVATIAATGVASGVSAGATTISASLGEVVNNGGAHGDATSNRDFHYDVAPGARGRDGFRDLGCDGRYSALQLVRFESLPAGWLEFELRYRGDHRDTNPQRKREIYHSGDGFSRSCGNGQHVL